MNTEKKHETDRHTDAQDAGLPTARLTVNVGITGHRKSRLPGNGEGGCTSGIIHSILEHIKGTVLRLHRDDRHLLKLFDKDAAPRLRVISSLAEGVDRMAAAGGLELGYELQCPLPNRRDIYEKSFEFPEDTPVFHNLLARADSVFEITSCNSESSQAYADAARVMMHHSDILISVWDGKKTKYIAGTYATMQEARRSHIPILYIPVDAKGDDEVVMFMDTESHSDWRAALDRHLEKILLPPEGVRHITEKAIPAAAYGGRRSSGIDKKMEDFILRPLQYPMRALRNLCRRNKGSAPAPDTTPGYGEAAAISQAAWGAPKRCFSSLSGYYSAGYHSRAFYRFMLPVAAVLALIFAMYCPQFGISPDLLDIGGWGAMGRCILPTLFYTLQMCLLMAVIFLVLKENRERKHIRYYSTRYMAERCRQSIFLWPMGFCNVHFTPGTTDFPSWYYRLIAREKGLPALQVDKQTVTDWLRWLKAEFANKQHGYHAMRQTRCAGLERRMQKLGMVFFALGMVFTLLQAVVYIIAVHGGQDAPSDTWSTLIISIALFMPCLAAFCTSYAGLAGYSANFAVSEGMQQYFGLLGKDVDFLLASAEKPSSTAGTLRFNGELCYTDLLDLCERIDAACMDELTDWESTTRTRCLTYV